MRAAAVAAEAGETDVPPPAACFGGADTVWRLRYPVQPLLEVDRSHQMWGRM